jgi:hypothetical protein
MTVLTGRNGLGDVSRRCFMDTASPISGTPVRAALGTLFDRHGFIYTIRVVQMLPDTDTSAPPHSSQCQRGSLKV